MDTIEYATFRYDTVEVENGLEESDKVLLTNLHSVYFWIVVASVFLASSCCLWFHLVGILSSWNIKLVHISRQPL